MKKILFSLSFFALFSTAFFVFGTQHVAAATWCGVMANPTSPNSTISANCINGQNYTALNGLGTTSTSSATLKANFKSYINSKSASGYGFQKIGAAFIKNGLDGGSGTWSSRIDNPAVTFKMETFNSCGTAWPNTAFSITSNTVVNDPSCRVATPALVIRLSGVIKYAIKVDCGNPMGNLGALPAYDWTLSGSTSVAQATAKPGDIVNFKHTVKNLGPSTATYSWVIQKSLAGAAWSNVTGTVTSTTGSGGSNPNAIANNPAIPAGALNGQSYCQRVYYTRASGPGSGAGASAYKCVTVVVPPSFDGVKIDNSGVSAVGSGAGYGGNCSGAGACAGGLAAYPFSDDIVSFGGTSLGSANPFFHNNFAAGTYTVSITDAGTSPDTGWRLVGYSICNDAGCTSNYLTISSHIAGGASFSHTFVNGSAYHMRWIFEPTITATCVPPTIAPASPEDGEPFNMTTYMGTTNLATSPRDLLSVQVKNSAGTVIYPTTNQVYTATSGMVTASPISFGGLAFGTYTVTTTLTGTNVISSPVSCTGPLNIVRKPYFKVYGGDIFAGGAFKAASGICPALLPGNGNLTGQYKSGIGGASTELAAIAIIKISGVASASLRTTFPAAAAANNLTFANTGLVGLSPPSYMGGNYGAGAYCAPDYFSDEQAAGLSNVAYTTPLDASTLADGGQTLVTPAAGRVQINASAPVSIRHTIFVNGDVQITSNLNYAAVAGNNPAVIPYLTIIAKGNIYIDPSVTNISGLFIAQPKAPGVGGYVFTCRDASNSPTGASFVGTCATKLTINGAFIAQRVILQRTIGSVIKAGGFGGVNELAGSANVAEVFQDSPELYVGRPVFKPNSNFYDSIKGLPPVL